MQQKRPTPVTDEECCLAMKELDPNGVGLGSTAITQHILIQRQKIDTDVVLKPQAVSMHLQTMVTASRPLVAVNDKAKPHQYFLIKPQVKGSMMATGEGTTASVEGVDSVKGGVSPPKPPVDNGESGKKEHSNGGRAQLSQEEQQFMDEHDKRFDEIIVAQGLWGFPRDRRKTEWQIRNMNLDEKGAWLKKAIELAAAGAMELQAEKVKMTQTAVQELAPAILEKSLVSRDSKISDLEKSLATLQKSVGGLPAKVTEEARLSAERDDRLWWGIMLSVLASVLITSCVALLICWWWGGSGAGAKSSPPPPAAAAPEPQSSSKKSDNAPEDFLDEEGKKLLEQMRKPLN